MRSKPEWFEKAVFYQIYPQSFYDSNGDGIGDIPGIIEKLDYLESLGITACWLNPCFESPFQDAGYDVADYYKVAERYGTNLDLKRLFEEGRKRNIRIILDLVAGHTSIQHPWFLESCKSGVNQYTDYYIWTDSCWTWDVPGYKVISGYSQRDGCYITNFFYSQPALNYGFANPDPHRPWQQSVDAPGPTKVRQELKNIIRFWLDMGASGFRVDMAPSLVKGDFGYRQTSQIWQEIRAWLDIEYPDACLLSEWGVPSLAIPAGFHADFCLPFGMPSYTALFRKPYGSGPGNDRYGFSFFDSRGNGNIMEFLDEYLLHLENTRGKGQIILPSGNHDINPRISKGRTKDDLKMVFLFILTMPGIPIIWYGDEIGMLGFDHLPSKEGGYNRTGVRTPMQWSEDNHAGYSTANPEMFYLPIDPSPNRPNVISQENNPDSLLNYVRRLVAIRKKYQALQASAEIKILFAQPGSYPLVYSRSDGTDKFIIAVNPSASINKALIPRQSKELPQTLIGEDGVFSIKDKQWSIQLHGVSGGIYRIAQS